MPLAIARLLSLSGAQLLLQVGDAFRGACCCERELWVIRTDNGEEKADHAGDRAVSLGIEVMNRAPLLRTCEWLLILGAFSISSIIIIQVNVVRSVPTVRDGARKRYSR